ncbi:MAG: aldo/keto reductase [Cyanobacteria bacterium P01_E01_bin.35]
MNSREFGRSGIHLSPVTFGSMRLNPQRIELATAVDLITYLYQSGVNTFHSSHEYETDPFFCQVIQQFKAQHPGAEVVHIAKIGVPHFDEMKFDSAKLVALIEQRLRQLHTERIDLVQWLVRHQPNDDQHRLPILAECQSELAVNWTKLQHEGKVGALASFPYSVPFAEAVLQFPICQGLVTYLNLLELEMAPFLDSMEQQGQGYVAIRPLLGGAITTESVTNSANNSTHDLDLLKSIMMALNIPVSEVTKFAVQFPLLHPAVASMMISVTSIEHAAEIIEAAQESSDRQRFQEILKMANSAISN